MPSPGEGSEGRKGEAAESQGHEILRASPPSLSHHFARGRVCPEQEPPRDRGGGGGGKGQDWVIKFRCPTNCCNLTLTVRGGQALGAAVRSAPRTAH